MKALVATISVILLAISYVNFSMAEEKVSGKADGHKDGESEVDGHEQGGEDEGEGSVGPNKGILEAIESKGFKLSGEALKNFEIKTLKLTGDGPWTIPQRVVVHSGEEVNVFRLRDGYFKSIDFQNIRKTQDSLVVDSDDLREGDEIVTAGLGFLKISELAAFGGVAHGHSH